MFSRISHYWGAALLRVQLMLARYISGPSQVWIVDIGASSIQAPMLRHAYLATRIDAFDPDPRAADDFLDLKFEVVFHPFAVAGSEGLKKLYLTKKSHCSSLLRPVQTSDTRYQVEREVFVDCRTLDSFEMRPDIVKIDVQGAELDIIQAGESSLSSANVVILEVWFDYKYHSQPSIEQIHRYMEENGFVSAGFSSLYFDSPSHSAGISFADMMFVRPPGCASYNAKVVLVSLIESSLDKLITRLVIFDSSRLLDRLLLVGIKLLGLFKSSGPKVY